MYIYYIYNYVYIYVCINGKSGKCGKSHIYRPMAKIFGPSSIARAKARIHLGQMFLQGFANEFGGRPFLEAIGPCAACSDVNHSSLLKYGSKTWWSPHIFLDPCNPPWIPASCWSNRQFLLQICIYCLKNWTSNSCSLKSVHEQTIPGHASTLLLHCQVARYDLDACDFCRINGRVLSNESSGDASPGQKPIGWWENHKSKTTTNTERVPSGKLT